MSDAWRERVAVILEIIARDGLPNPHDLDVALDAIACDVAALIEAARREEREANIRLADMYGTGKQGMATSAAIVAAIRARGDA